MAIPTIETKEYSIGMGRVLFQNGYTYTGKYRDLGNVKEGKITIETEKKEHFSTKGKLKVKDKEIITQIKATGSLTLEDININNFRMFMLGDNINEQTITAGNVTDESITAAIGLWLPLQYKSISNVVVKDSGGTTTYTAGIDYEVDEQEGLIRVLPGGAINDGDNILVSYDYAGYTKYQFKAAKNPVLQGHIYYVPNPPTGYLHAIKGYATLNPTGDFTLISDDWISIGFNLEFVEHPQYDSLFIFEQRII